MNIPNPDIKKMVRDKTNRLIDLQYKVDLLKKTHRNDLINLVRHMINKDKK